MKNDFIIVILQFVWSNSLIIKVKQLTAKSKNMGTCSKHVHYLPVAIMDWSIPSHHTTLADVRGLMNNEYSVSVRAALRAYYGQIIWRSFFSIIYKQKRGKLILYIVFYNLQPFLNSKTKVFRVSVLDFLEGEQILSKCSSCSWGACKDASKCLWPWVKGLFYAYAFEKLLVCHTFLPMSKLKLLLRGLAFVYMRLLVFYAYTAQYHCPASVRPLVHFILDTLMRFLGNPRERSLFILDPRKIRWLAFGQICPRSKVRSTMVTQLYKQTFPPIVSVRNLNGNEIRLELVLSLH